MLQIFLKREGKAKICLRDPHKTSIHCFNIRNTDAKYQWIPDDADDNNNFTPSHCNPAHISIKVKGFQDSLTFQERFRHLTDLLRNYKTFDKFI